MESRRSSHHGLQTSGATATVFLFTATLLAACGGRVAEDQAADGSTASGCNGEVDCPLGQACSNGACVPIEDIADANPSSPDGSTNAVDPPTGLFLTPSATTLVAGAPFSLTWGSTGADSCHGIGPNAPGVAGWTGQALATNQGAPGLSLILVQGNYVFEMRCDSAGGSATVQTTSITVNAAPTPTTDFCSSYYDGVARPVPTTPQFTAHGFTKVEVPFATVWGVQPGIAGSGPVAVPGNFLNPVVNRYLAIPVTLVAPAQQMNMAWLESQGVGIPSASVSWSISPCPGDFRPRDLFPPANDAFLGSNCGGAALAFSGTLSIAKEGEGLAGCQIPLDTKVYLNIAPHDMFQATPPAVSQCGENPVCGLAFTVE